MTNKKNIINGVTIWKYFYNKGGKMVNGISSATSTFASYLQPQQKTMSGADMFSKLSGELGIEDGSDITADQLNDYIEEIESSDSEDKGKLGFLKQLQKNFDTIAGSDGTISSSDMVSNEDLLKPPSQGGGAAGAAGGMSAANMYSNLISDLGLSDGDEIDEDTLNDYIEELKASGSTQDQQKLGFLTQLQENFDSVAGVDGAISSSDIESNYDLLKPPSFSMSTDWLDPSEITSDMVQPPIDLRV